MTNILIIILTISLLLSCNNSSNKTVSKNDRIELSSEPDKTERLKYESVETLKKSNCKLTDPDTSICGIKIRDAESATAMIGNKDKTDSLEQYHYYSKHKREILTLTQHPGDGKNQISIFRVEYSKKSDYGYKQLQIDTFKSEKGIKLGMTKKQIGELLGTCYATIDSAKNYIELYYRLELPNDSRTKLLQTNNMPIYYGSYKFLNDKLEAFEFGFEYP